MPARSALLWPALVAAATAAVHVALALRVDQFVATVGEARLAAAAFAVRGGEIAVDLPPPDAFAVRQIAVVATLLPTAGVPVVDAARHATLALGVVSVLLLWPALRHIGVGPAPAAVAAGTVGVLPPVVALHAGITAAAPAVVWLVLAAALVALVRHHVVASAVAAGLAVLTAPLVAAALLALGGHLLHEKVVGSSLPDGARSTLSTVLGVGALGVAFAAAGNGPLAGVGGPVVGPATTALVVGTGAVLAALAWVRHRELRPALTPTVLLLVVALIPGAARSAALLLVLPFLALVGATLLDTAVEPVATRPAVTAVPVVGLVAALVVGLLATVDVRPAPPVSLAAWAGAELGPDVVLRADPLDRAELLADGVAPERLGGLDGPARPGEVLIVSDRPTNGVPDVTPRCAPLATLASVPRGTGGAPTAVCPLAPAPSAAEQAGRSRFGDALSRNPALTLSPAAAAELRAGLVDPRLILVLADLASPRRLAIADFPTAPYEPDQALRRRVLLTAVDGMPASGSPQPLLRSFLASQQPPFVPGAVQAQGPALLICYPAPTPAGLLAG